jgi:predicted anti-sigma-YlaC factor YlaD
MMTCKQVSTLVSIRHVEEASTGQRMAVQFHLMMCKHCRAFRRQLRVIGRIAGLIAHDVEREPTPAFENRILDRLRS